MTTKNRFEQVKKIKEEKIVLKKQKFFERRQINKIKSMLYKRHRRSLEKQATPKWLTKEQKIQILNIYIKKLHL
jgi:hypothetical protein